MQGQRKSRKGVELLPLAPFQEWLIEKEVEYGGKKRLAWATSMSERQLFTLITGWESVSDHKQCGGPARRKKMQVEVDVVDRVLLAEGSTFLWELYGHLYRWSPEEWDEFYAEMHVLEAQDQAAGINPLTGLRDAA